MLTIAKRMTAATWERGRDKLLDLVDSDPDVPDADQPVCRAPFFPRRMYPETETVLWHYGRDKKMSRILRVMSARTWKNGTQQLIAIIKLLDYAQPAAPPSPLRAGVLATAHRSIDVEFAVDQSTQPPGWSSSAEGTRTVFAMESRENKPVTLCEALLWHFILRAYLGFLHGTDLLVDGETPPTVPSKVWTDARLGHAKAVRQANRIRPGSIYGDATIFAHIYRHTLLAAMSPDRDLAFESREWLAQALLPFSSYSKRGGTKDSPRAELGVPHLVIFWRVYEDIVLIRQSIGTTRAHNGTLPIIQVKMLFPELWMLRGRTAAGEDRRPWSNLIAGRRIDAATNLEICDPRKAAIQILGDITGFRSRHVYRRLLEIHGGDLKRSLQFLRAKATLAAKKLRADHGPRLE
jgi:hypothetical protein